MKIRKDIKRYSDEIAKLAYESYKEEISMHAGVQLKSYKDYQEFMNHSMKDINGFVYLEGEKCLGYILYNTWEENSNTCCSIPEWGYGAESDGREKIISYLFQTLAEEMVKERTVHFSVNLYAHDTEIQRLFSYMEFGTQAEIGICQLEKTEVSDAVTIRERGKETVREEVLIRKIPKKELVNRWNEIWNLLSQLIDHLKKSPIFYGGEEFTEDVYMEFFADAGTKVYIAEQSSEIIGLIAANKDTISQVFKVEEAVNVGEVFVLPDYRGMDIAQALLGFACKDLAEAGYHFAWVEHGTANPNARYFWNKYFATYKYEMVRMIGKM